jgi:RHS repeat-associated protein
VQERYTYTPFGQVTFRDNTGSTLSNSAKDWIFLHQGGERIAAGDYEFRNRVYSPSLGRWLSCDPLGFEAGDQNWYRAIGNNPIFMFDPSGLWSLGGAFGGMVTGSGVGAGVGATVGAPLFGIGALPGAIGGGLIGGIGGFIAGGVFTEPAFSGISGSPQSQLSVAEEVSMGMIIGTPVGAAGAIAGPVGLALANGTFWTSSTAYFLGLTAPGATMTVSHWGKPGIYPGSWVMVGKPDLLNWILAGGPKIGPYISGFSYKVPVQNVVLPIWGGSPWYEWPKFWQRMIK